MEQNKTHTVEDLDKILKDLEEIVNDPIITGAGTGISLSPNNLKFSWVLSNIDDYLWDYSILIDSPETAYTIIHRFSDKTTDKGISIDEIREGMLKHNKFNTSQPLYLHFKKQLKRKNPEFP